MRDKGDLRGAATLFESLIPAAEQINDRLSLAHAENGLGSILLRREQYPAALRHFDASVSGYEAASYKAGVAYALADRAGVLSHWAATVKLRLHWTRPRLQHNSSAAKHLRRRSAWHAAR